MFTTDITKRTYAVVLYGLMLIAIGCAKIQPPPGGPVDNTGPTPISTIPEQGQTKVDVNSKLEILFYARLQRTEPNLVSLSPFPKSGLKVLTKGRKLVIQPMEPLQKDRTYRLTLSSQLKNERNNPMSQPLELVFSTGDSIDKGFIRGQIYDTGDRRGIWIWGWRVDPGFTARFRNGEPEPWWDVPDVVASTDSAGKFVLSGLTNGKYRLFALDDKDGDHRYDPTNDRLGITFDDAIVPRDSSILFTFQLANRDTIAPQILSARMVAPQIASIRFTRPVYAAFGRNPFIHAVDPNSFVGISYPDPSDSLKWWTVFPSTPPKDTLQLAFGNLIDRQENALPDSIVTKPFPTRIKTDDTLAPHIFSLNPMPGWVTTMPTWILQTSTSLELGTINNSITGMLLPDSTKLQFNVRQTDAVTAKIAPTNKLPERSTFNLSISTKNWKSMTGVASQDTTIDYRFQVLPEDTTGSMQVKVDDNFLGRKGAVRVEAVLSNLPGSAFGWTNNATAGADITSDTSHAELLVMPGTYHLRAFCDWNQNGYPDVGHLRPFRFAEPLTISRDTVRVRSRWTNEGIRLRLR